jgi:hypothetical protein
MNKRRILALALYLEQLPRKYAKRFKMGSWKSTNFAHICGTETEDLTKSCGTTACALGWATQMPSMRRLGLHYDDGMPRLANGQYGFGAASKLFELTREQAFYLFDQERIGEFELNEDETPKQWAKRARKFVANGGKVPDAEST